MTWSNKSVLEREQLPSNAEEEGIANLAGGTSDGDTHGLTLRGERLLHEGVEAGNSGAQVRTILLEDLVKEN